MLIPPSGNESVVISHGIVIAKIQRSHIPSKYFPDNFQKITKNIVTISPIKPILPTLPIKIPSKKRAGTAKRCRLSTRKGSHILYFSTAEAQTSFIFHLPYHSFHVIYR